MKRFSINSCSTNVYCCYFLLWLPSGRVTRQHRTGRVNESRFDYNTRGKVSLCLMRLINKPYRLRRRVGRLVKWFGIRFCTVSWVRSGWIVSKPCAKGHKLDGCKIRDRLNVGILVEYVDLHMNIQIVMINYRQNCSLTLDVFYIITSFIKLSIDRSEDQSKVLNRNKNH